MYFLDFGSAQDDSNQFVLKGPKDHLGKAREHFLSLVGKLSTQVSETVAIPMKYYGAVLGRSGANVRAIEAKHLSLIHI